MIGQVGGFWLQITLQMQPEGTGDVPPMTDISSDLTLPRFPPPSAGREALPAREYAALARQNVLAVFSERAFTEEVLERRLFGRVQLTLNRPAAIRHVLIDNPENYARTSATLRLLYPIVGRGLLLAEGEEWRVQRRTVAPSFAPRTVPFGGAACRRGCRRAGRDARHRDGRGRSRRAYAAPRDRNRRARDVLAQHGAVCTAHARAVTGLRRAPRAAFAIRDPAPGVDPD